MKCTHKSNGVLDALRCLLVFVFVFVFVFCPTRNKTLETKLPHFEVLFLLRFHSNQDEVSRTGQRPLHWPLYTNSICICICICICRVKQVRDGLPLLWWISQWYVFESMFFWWICICRVKASVEQSSPATLLAEKPPAWGWYNLSVWTPLYSTHHSIQSSFYMAT